MTINRLRGFRSLLFSFAAVAMAISTAIFLSNSSAAAADPVEYVKVCSLYGAGFFYIPGTSICLNVQHHDAREQTEGGTWRWQIPDSPWNFINSTPRNACRGGKLLKFGSLTNSDLTVNTHQRIESTQHLPLNLKKGQYVASVLYRGGLFTTQYQVADLPDCPSPNTTVTDATDTSCTAGAAPVGGGTEKCEVACVNGGWEFTGNQGGSINGDVCTYYYSIDPNLGPEYSFPLGCVDTEPLANLSGTIRFTANSPLPSFPTSQPVYITVAGGYTAQTTTTSIIQGKLTVWLCLKK